MKRNQMRDFNSIMKIFMLYVETYITTKLLFDFEYIERVVNNLRDKLDISPLFEILFLWYWLA
jgi:hypothetical protein